MGIRRRILFVWCTSVERPLMNGSQTMTKSKRRRTMKRVKTASLVSRDELTWL